jgi:ABC-type glutathione transport system ATPase component
MKNNNTIIAIVGPCGSGKSAILHAFARELSERKQGNSILVSESSPAGIAQFVQNKSGHTVMIDDGNITGDEWATKLLNDPLIKSAFDVRKIIRIEVL